MSSVAADEERLLADVPAAVGSAGEGSEAATELWLLLHGCGRRATDFFAPSSSCVACRGLSAERRVVAMLRGDAMWRLRDRDGSGTDRGGTEGERVDGGGAPPTGGGVVCNLSFLTPLAKPFMEVLLYHRLLLLSSVPLVASAAAASEPLQQQQQ